MSKSTVHANNGLKKLAPAIRLLPGRNAAVVFLFFALAISLPVLILGGFVIHTSLRNAEEEALRANDAAARLATQALSQRMTDLRSLLESHAPHIAVMTGKRNHLDVRDHLNSIRSKSHDLAFVSVISSSGKVLARTPDHMSHLDRDLSMVNWYREFINRGKKPFISDAFKTLAPPHTYVAVVAVPLTDEDGQAAGSLAGAIRLTSIQAWLDSIRLREGGYIYVVDRTGLLVARPGLGSGTRAQVLKDVTPVRKVLRKESGAGRFYNPLTGRDELSAYVPVPELGWGVVAQQPTESALRTAYDLAQRTGLMAILLVSLSLAIAAFIVSLYRRNQSLYDQLANSLTRERGIAGALQESLLSKTPDSPHLDVGIRHVSATAGALVGGDFFDVISLDDAKVAIVLGDVCGKGVTTAVQTAVVRGLIRGLVVHERSPSALLEKLNERLMALSGTFVSAETFVTLIIGIYDSSDGSFVYSQAGHPSPIVANRSEALVLEQLRGPALGVIEEASFEESCIVLNRENTFLMYTDGLLETRHNQEFFGEDRILRIFTHYSELPPQDLVERIFRECVRFARGKLTDDVAIMAIRKSDLPHLTGVNLDQLSKDVGIISRPGSKIKSNQPLVNA